MNRSVFYICSAVLAVSHVNVADGATSLDATSNLWGGAQKEYRAAVFSALSEARCQEDCNGIMCEWFTNMVAYVCPERSFETWMREKTFMIGVGMRMPEIASSAECWLSAADCYAKTKRLKTMLSEDATQEARLAFLTNGNTTAYYSALRDDKCRLVCLRAASVALPTISNAVLASFPSVILPRLDVDEQWTLLSNVTTRASLTNAESLWLESFCPARDVHR